MLTPLKPINQIFKWLAVAAFVLFVSLAVKDTWLFFMPATSAAISNPGISPKRNPFTDLNLEAKAALVFAPDVDKILFAHNADASLPIASLTKVMTALASEWTLGREGAVPFNGHPWQLGNLVNYTLISSSNAAAAAITAAADRHSPNQSLITTMNNLATTLDLTATHFDNTTGLDSIDGQAENVSSAKDIARLFTYVLKNQPTIITATRYPELEVVALDGIRYRVVNTNKIIGEIPGLLASKTGYTEAAQGNLVVITDRGLNEPIIFVILGSSLEGRFWDMKKLIAATYAYDY